MLSKIGGAVLYLGFPEAILTDASGTECPGPGAGRERLRNRLRRHRGVSLLLLCRRMAEQPASPGDTRTFFYILLLQKPICLYHNISFLRLPNVYPAQPLAPQGFAGFKGLDFRPFVYLNVYPA